MKDFQNYLEQEDYAKTTIGTYLKIQEKFCDWCEAKNYDPITTSYKECLEYVKKLQESSVSKKTVKHQVGALKIFFKYLIEENYRGDSPVESINIRGVKRILNHNLLEFEELEDLYYSYQTENITFPNCPSVAIRNKVITGFMVYQGMNATALKSLQYDHISIDKGTVYIPSTRMTNSRTLELKSWQIVPLLRYMEKDRELLQEKVRCYTNALFPLTIDRFYIVYEIFKELRKFNHKVKNGNQIRASVLTFWLGRHNIREVQYMAGHRYISSTERYLQDDLENLHEAIESLHPIN
ncbi:MAG: phage integrase N-terminal SAM-like domain-containing protein [Flavobacteriaceae bacterium]|nr:phage integrase N-terminal SAM-like domain-containing protein [Flavobacteriaceae bacterium]